MPTASDKNLHGKRYTHAQKEEILRFIFAHKNSTAQLREALKKAFGAGNFPDISTINRWILDTPKTELEKLKPQRYQNEHLENQTERRINRGKMAEDPSILSMRSLYLCFHRAYPPKNSDGKYGDPNKYSHCSSYSKFLEYLLEKRNLNVSIGYLQKQLSHRPCSQRARDAFGSDNCLDNTVYQQIKNLITKNDNGNFINENSIGQQVLAKELKACISVTTDLSEYEKKYVQSSIDIYEEKGQPAYLVSGVISLLNYIIYGKKTLFADIRLDRNVIEMINRMCVPHEYVSEYLTTALTVGINGRMGRHELLHLFNRHEDINPLAAYELGESYYSAGDYDTAYKYFQEAYARGHAVAAWSLGYMLVNNRGTYCRTFAGEEARFKEAYEYFVIGRELGSTAAVHAIGQLYMRGKMVNDQLKFDDPDYEKAKECFYQAIDKNYFYSHNALGWVFEKQAKACEDDKKRMTLLKAAYNEYEKASKWSDGYSRNKLGTFWEDIFCEQEFYKFAYDEYKKAFIRNRYSRDKLDDFWKYILSKRKFYRIIFDEHKEASKPNSGYSRNKLSAYLASEYSTYVDANNENEEASKRNDGYSQSVSKAYEIYKCKCKKIAAFHYLDSLEILESDVEPWSHYNVGRVFCGLVSSESAPDDNEFSIKERIPNIEKAKFHLKIGATFLEQQCKKGEPKDLNNDLLLKYLDCVLQLTKQNIAAVDKSYFESLSIVQKALDCAEQWLLFVENSENTSKINRCAVLEIQRMCKWISKKAKQIEAIARETMNPLSSFTLPDSSDD